MNARLHGTAELGDAVGDGVGIKHIDALAEVAGKGDGVHHVLADTCAAVKV